MNPSDTLQGEASIALAEQVGACVRPGDSLVITKELNTLIWRCSGTLSKTGISTQAMSFRV